jgi:hypothetical protein
MKNLLPRPPHSEGYCRKCKAPLGISGQCYNCALEDVKPNNHPVAIIIFVPGDGKFHMTGVHRNSKQWKYSNWVILPESELGAFTLEMVSIGFAVFDVRHLAAQKTPGMEDATPILLYREKHITIKEVIDAYGQILTAILNLPDSK